MEEKSLLKYSVGIGYSFGRITKAPVDEFLYRLKSDIQVDDPFTPKFMERMDFPMFRGVERGHHFKTFGNKGDLVMVLDIDSEAARVRNYHMDLEYYVYTKDLEKTNAKNRR